MFVFKLNASHKPSLLPLIEEGHALIGQRTISYVVYRKPNRRRIALFIEPSGRLRFLAPLRTRTPTIDRFLNNSQDWIRGRLKDLQQYPAPYFPETFAEGVTLHYLGEAYCVAITHKSDTQQACHVDGDQFIINLPNADGVSRLAMEEDIRLEVLLWYKKQARLYLKERTAFWADYMNLRPRSIKITSPTRQWGSCSAKNDVRLNWRVMMAPQPVIDYLIVHELAHIPYKNHSMCFWNCVGHFLPDYKNLRQILRRMDAGCSA